ncbi:MAG: DNA-directed polymerase sigma-70 factor [Myxococcaceae bacterium]|nr:DNA-directed polymerase sigma-70 factor [Myxococcaceae bacterium]
MDFSVSDEEVEGWAKAHGLAELTHREDARLAIGCSRGDPAALTSFDQQYTPIITVTARRFGDADFVSEVCQLVRQKLLVAQTGAGPAIKEYGGRGQLAKYVQAVAVRTALNLLQANKRHTPLQGDEALLETPSGADDPELASIKLRYRTEFKEAFAAAMASLDDTSRNALRLHHLDGLTLANLGALYAWSVPTASRRLAAARASLLAATRTIMSDRLRLNPSELDSVLRLIESRLSVEFPKG